MSILENLLLLFLYLLYICILVFQINIFQFEFNSIHSEPQMQSACRIPALSLIFMFLMSLACVKYQSSIHKQFSAIISIICCSYCLQADHSCVFECIVSASAEATDAGVEHHSQSDASRCL